MIDDQIHQAQLDNINHTVDGAMKRIWITFQKEGIHKFPEALEDPNLEDVSFLGYPHRHIFHFRVWITVQHNDREIEFIQFKRWVEGLYLNKALDLNNKSCEMISDDLFKMISSKYYGREIWIEISEDGENGSFVKYNDPRIR